MRAFWETGQRAESLPDHVSHRPAVHQDCRPFACHERDTALILEFTGVGRCQKSKKQHLATLSVHAGQEPDPTTGSRAVPIYQTTSYVFKDADHAARLFGLQEFGNIYTRIMNPTTDVFEKRIAALEGERPRWPPPPAKLRKRWPLRHLAGAGDEIVSTTSLYGGTYNLFHYTLPRLGINVRFVDADDFDGLRAAINEKTRAVYTETLGNPKLDIADIEKLASIAHQQGVPLMIDNTAATPILCRPIEWGADIVVESATKYIGGHGTSIGGVIVDGGQVRLEGLRTLPRLCRARPFVSRPVVRGSVWPPGLYSQSPGAGSARHRRGSLALQCFSVSAGAGDAAPAHGKALAERAGRGQAPGRIIPAVEWVNYPGLPSSKYYARAKKYMPEGQSSLVTFGIKGGFEAGKKLINSLKLFSLLANIGDAKSLVIHPASTTHSQLSVEEQNDTGVTPELVRLSVGIEDVRDILADLNDAIEVANGHSAKPVEALSAR